MKYMIQIVTLFLLHLGSHKLIETILAISVVLNVFNRKLTQ